MIRYLVLRLFLLVIFWGTWTVAWAVQVDFHAAQTFAAQWFQQRQSRSFGVNHLHLDYATPSSYLFSADGDFVWVGGEGKTVQLCGYGRKGEGELPLALKEWMENSVVSTPKCDKLDVQYVSVEPLLPFVRHQSAPYNNCCPLYKESNGVITPYRCLVGCVATALEEVISYYRRVVVLKDTLHGWETSQYVIDDVLPGTSVDCRLIRNNYDVDDYTDAEADAVARLSYYCGVAAHMRWGIASSGANIRNLVDPLRRAFGYGYVHYVDSYQYTPSDWLQMMRNEILAHRPVLYAAFNMWLAGHAFVLDGLDANGFFHVNWGYSGSYDGYFSLDVLNFNEPLTDRTECGDEAGFFTNHQALLLHPDKIEANLPEVLQRTGREIAIDSVVFHLSPETGKHTPATVYVRNMTDQALTTPLEFLTNLPTDTSLLEQADFVALGNTRLAPHERKAYRVHLNFNEEGERLLRISPDDSIFLYVDTLVVDEGREPQLNFQLPQLKFLDHGDVLVEQLVSNAEDAGRSGQEVLYEIGLGDSTVVKDGTRHSRHLYVQPGETLKDTVRFRHLEVGKTYTLLVRSPWKIKVQKTFVYPDVSAVDRIVTSEANAPVYWYDLDGRPMNRPDQRGVFLRRRGHQVEKIFIQP